MLHEPVARLQKNALVLHDLLKYTENDDDQRLLKNALRLNQKFLNDLNLDAARRLFMVSWNFFFAIFCILMHSFFLPSDT